MWIPVMIGVRLYLSRLYAERTKFLTGDKVIWREFIG